MIAEQMERDPILAYVEQLEKYEAADPLQFDGVKGSPEEWSNIPKLVARYCIVLQSHLKALVEYNYQKSQEENTESLRKFVEE